MYPFKMTAKALAEPASGLYAGEAGTPYSTNLSALPGALRPILA